MIESWLSFLGLADTFRLGTVPHQTTASRVVRRAGWSVCGGSFRLMSQKPKVTAEQLDRAIKITAHVMVRHNLPQILPTLKRLEGEHRRLSSEGDPIDYAKRILASDTMKLAA